MLSAVSDALLHILELIGIFIKSLMGTNGTAYNLVYFRALLIVIPIAICIAFLVIKLIKKVTWGR